MRLALSLPPFAWLMLSSIFYAVGEYSSKKFANQPKWEMGLLVCTFYLLGTLAWLPAIVQTKMLATTGTAWFLLSLLATIAIGIGIFHEKVNSLQIMGICLALLALVLISHEG
jgi:drug/metabolite transporter (DMT)-like permease